jgi:membrane protein required for colicin V production
MVWVDFALAGLVLVSALVGVFRGFVKEALSLAVWVLAIWVAWNFAPSLADKLSPWIDDPILRVWAARVASLIGVVLIGALATSLIGLLVGHSGLTGTDRLLGMLFGVGRGVLLAAIVVVALQFAGFDQSPWWRESKLIPYAAPIADKLRDAAAEGVEKLAA